MRSEGDKVCGVKEMKDKCEVMSCKRGDQNQVHNIQQERVQFLSTV